MRSFQCFSEAQSSEDKRIFRLQCTAFSFLLIPERLSVCVCVSISKSLANSRGLG